MAKKRDAGEVAKKPPSCTFEELAKLGPQPLKIGDQVIGQVEVKEFKTKSYGLSFTGKGLIPLPENKVARCQCSVNLIVINSAPVVAEENSAPVVAEEAA